MNICPRCGSKFYPRSSKLQRFCSTKCKRDGRTKDGILSIIDIGSYRTMIIDRDNYTCQECWIVFDPKDLVVHHIKPLKDGGDNEPSNMMTVCVYCHALLHTRFDSHGALRYIIGGSYEQKREATSQEGNQES